MPRTKKDDVLDLPFTVKKYSAQEAKDEIIRQMLLGNSVKTAVQVVGKGIGIIQYYKQTDDEWYQDYERALAAQRNDKVISAPKQQVPDFPEFCKVWLKSEVFWHQLQWFDMLEGREPRELHAAESYEPAIDRLTGQTIKRRIIINTPPEHAKTSTIRMWLTWRIVKDPNFHAIYVSKTEKFAIKQLKAIQGYLISPEYKAMQDAFGPVGGWKSGSMSWQANQFYIGNSAAADPSPTLQALGLSSQIYGDRANVIVCDDIVDKDNAHQFEEQIEFLQNMATTRMFPGSGRLIIAGTRVKPNDLYYQLTCEERNPNGTTWTKLRQPAVLEYSEDPHSWVTLWPWSDRLSGDEEYAVEPNEKGLYPRFTSERLFTRREDFGNDLAAWSRLYQQEQIAEDAHFKMDVLRAAVQERPMGMLPDNEIIGRKGGMEGCKIIVGMDPGHRRNFTAVSVWALDVQTEHRYLIDGLHKTKLTPEEQKETVRYFLDKYNVFEYVIESNGYQYFLSEDAELRRYAISRGARIVSHTTTGVNKHDSDDGVLLLSDQFESGMLHLPSSELEYTKKMIEQFATWEPEATQSTKKNKNDDLPMCAWIAGKRMNEIVRNKGPRVRYTNNPFTTSVDLKRRQQTNLSRIRYA